MHNVNLEYLEETFDISPKVNGSQGKAHKAAIETATREILYHIGEDPEREGLVRTPDRVARMYDELTAGYHTDPIKLINDAVFDVDYDEMVIVKDIDFSSLCEHGAVLRARPCGLHPRWQGGGFEQDPAHRGDVCPALAGAGTDDEADRRIHPGGAASSGSGSGS